MHYFGLYITAGVGYTTRSYCLVAQASARSKVLSCSLHDGSQAVSQTESETVVQYVLRLAAPAATS
jgi:hypothetical protein